MPSNAPVHAAGTPEEHTGEVRQLSTLLEASQALLREPLLRPALAAVLEILHRHHGAIRSTVVLLNKTSRDVELEVSAGDVDASRVRYRPGEGVTGQVLATGKPSVAPQVSREPVFLNHAAPRPELATAELSYISVPITIDGDTVGALGIDLAFKPDRDYQRAINFLGVVGSMIAHAVKIQRLIDPDRRKLGGENRQLREELKERYDYSNLVGTSGPMRLVHQQITQVARTNATVLLRGESGSGKELVAQAIHCNSPRANGPLIKVNCAALPEDLIEAELFGYEKGAFTGAYMAKKGRFELAEGGTLFLDEIGDLNLVAQVKLLRVLQEHEFVRLGGTKTIRANVRLIAATHKDLEAALAAGTFREDLYHRLNVFAIFIPPLRERKTDVLLLADHFLEKFSREHSKKATRISTPALDRLMAHQWPGNVRELANVIERAVVVSNTSVVHAHHLPSALQATERSDTHLNMPLQEALDAFERDLLQGVLRSTRGNRAEAARLLSTTARVFNYRVKRLRIDWRRFKVSTSELAESPMPRTEPGPDEEL